MRLDPKTRYLRAESYLFGFVLGGITAVHLRWFFAAWCAVNLAFWLWSMTHASDLREPPQSGRVDPTGYTLYSDDRGTA